LLCQIIKNQSGLGMQTRELYADIGGTNGRFALGAPGQTSFDRVDVLPSESYPTMEAMAEAWRQRVPDARIARASVAVAGPVTRDRGEVTNRGWDFAKDDLRRALKADQLLVVNDFEALAYALPHLPPSELMAIGGGEPVPGATKLVIGPGTGLGVGMLVPDAARGWRAIPSEGGHVTLPASGPDEVALLNRLTALDGSKGRIDVEDAVSGGGLVSLYRAVADRDGLPAMLGRPDEITAAALAGSDACAVRALDQFLAWLGVVAGDLALAVVPRGGVYIGGGICRRIAPALANSPLRHRFDAKGRMSHVVRPIPLYVILDAAPGLRGAAAALHVLGAEA
jgi:glucokinase